MNQKTKKRYGLPNYFKKIGFVIFLMAFVIKMFSSSIPVTIETLKIIVIDFAIIGLCLVILSEDKIEDEMTFQIRLRAFMQSFFFVVTFVIVTQLLDLFFDGTISDGFNAQQVVLFMCSTHVMAHYMNKWIAKWNERKNAKEE